jgi:hypothetical protein
MTQDYIQRGDGTTSTLLLGENVDAGFWADLNVTTGTTPTPTRRDLQTGYIAFGVSVTLTGVGPTDSAPLPPNTAVATGSFGGTANTTQLQTPNVGSGSAWGLEDAVVSTTSVTPNAAINSSVLTAPVGQTSRPSSNHPGISCFCFADGHALPLSQNIDSGVFMRALSPAGSLYGQQINDGDVH